MRLIRDRVVIIFPEFKLNVNVRVSHIKSFSIYLTCTRDQFNSTQKWNMLMCIYSVVRKLIREALRSRREHHMRRRYHTVLRLQKRLPFIHDQLACNCALIHCTIFTSQYHTICICACNHGIARNVYSRSIKFLLYWSDNCNWSWLKNSSITELYLHAWANFVNCKLQSTTIANANCLHSTTQYLLTLYMSCCRYRSLVEPRPRQSRWACKLVRPAVAAALRTTIWSVHTCTSTSLNMYTLHVHANYDNHARG